MTENPDDLVTLKIRLEDREWIINEQHKMRRGETKSGTKIILSHAELFRYLRAVYEAAEKDEAPPPLPPDKWHQMLTRIMKFGDKHTVSTMQGILQTYESIAKPPEASPAAPATAAPVAAAATPTAAAVTTATTAPAITTTTPATTAATPAANVKPAAKAKKRS